MKVLHLHESIVVAGGAEVYIQELQKLLPQYGWDSCWIGIRKTDWKKYQFSVLNGPAYQDLSLTQALTHLQEFIRDNEIDLINIHSVFEPDVLSFCLDSKPVIKFCHSPVMVCPGRDKFWRYSEKICDRKFGMHCFRHIYTEGCSNRHPRRVLEAWKLVNFEIGVASKRYARIVVMSDYIRNGLLECGVNEDRILLNPYFTPFVARDTRLADSYQMKRLVFLGRLVSSKGPHIMLRALDQVMQTHPEVVLDIVGSGLMENTLKKQVEDMQLSKRVIFHGWADRASTEKIIDDAFIVLFPSIYPESFGIVGIEAMMRGKPVVAFEVGGVSSWLQNGHTGFLVPGNDAPAMGEATARLLDDDQLYNTMSDQAYRAASKRFTPEIHMRRLAGLYQETFLSNQRKSTTHIA